MSNSESSGVFSVYAWPALTVDPSDQLDREWSRWWQAVQAELEPVYQTMRQPLPDDPIQLDTVVTQEIDGWLPRVASLSVIAEFYLATAKGARYPARDLGPDGKPITAGERDARYEGNLAGYRFVRDELDALTRRMSERVRWAQSVRKQHGDAN